METTQISSRKNRRLKVVRIAREKKDSPYIFLEGWKLIEEAFKSGLTPELAIVTNTSPQKTSYPSLFEKLLEAKQGVIKVPYWLMKELSCVQTPPGMILLCRRENISIDSLPTKASFVVIAHQIQDPGNMGSILRSAEAAGVDKVIITSNSTDALAPKALRGSMGAALRVPLWLGANLVDAISLCHQHALKVYASSPRCNAGYWSTDWTHPCALLLGSEGAGLDDESLKLCDHEIAIPMANDCESLNVGAAASAIFFEIARQRFEASDH